MSGYGTSPRAALLSALLLLQGCAAREAGPSSEKSDAQSELVAFSATEAPWDGARAEGSLLVTLVDESAYSSVASLEELEAQGELLHASVEDDVAGQQQALVWLLGIPLAIQGGKAAVITLGTLLVGATLIGTVELSSGEHREVYASSAPDLRAFADDRPTAVHPIWSAMASVLVGPWDGSDAFTRESERAANTEPVPCARFAGSLGVARTWPCGGATCARVDVCVSDLSLYKSAECVIVPPSRAELPLGDRIEIRIFNATDSAGPVTVTNLESVLTGDGIEHTDIRQIPPNTMVRAMLTDIDRGWATLKFFGGGQNGSLGVVGDEWLDRDDYPPACASISPFIGR